MNRRQLLLRGAVLAAMAPVVRAAGTVDADGPGRAAESMRQTGTSPLLALHDPGYRRSREFAAALQEHGAHQLAIEPDMLTLWHGVLRQACADTPALRLIGLTTRTDFLVLRDLARAAALAPAAIRDADASGASAGSARRRATLIGWVLAPRAAVI